MAAGVLCGGLLLMGGVKLGEILIPHQQLAENAYPFDVAEATATGGTSASAAPAEAEPIAPSSPALISPPDNRNHANARRVILLIKAGRIGLDRTFTISSIVALLRHPISNILKH